MSMYQQERRGSPNAGIQKYPVNQNYDGRDVNRLLTHNTKVPMAQKRHYSPTGSNAPNRTVTKEILDHSAGQVPQDINNQEQEIYNREKLLLE